MRSSRGLVLVRAPGEPRGQDPESNLDMRLTLMRDEDLRERLTFFLCEFFEPRVELEGPLDARGVTPGLEGGPRVPAPREAACSGGEQGRALSVRLRWERLLARRKCQSGPCAVGRGEVATSIGVAMRVPSCEERERRGALHALEGSPRLPLREASSWHDTEVPRLAGATRANRSARRQRRGSRPSRATTARRRARL